MIIFDTETTGLIQHVSTPLDQQPEIIEVAAIKVDDQFLEERDALTFLVKPKRLPLPAIITKITGFVDADLADALSFPRHVATLEAFFVGERIAVAHNIAYDIGMFELELRRLGRVTRFPWPPTQLCTVEHSLTIKGHRLKLGQLYEHAFGKPMVEAHRAMPDTRQLLDVVRWMRTQGMI